MTESTTGRSSELLLQLTGEPIIDERTIKLGTAALLFILGLEVLHLNTLGVLPPPHITIPFLVAPWFILSATSLFGQTRRISSIAGFILTCIAIGMYFPDVANHLWLLAYLFLFGSLVDTYDERERRRYTSLLRLLIAAVLFFSGIHKLINGYWFVGDVLIQIDRLADAPALHALEWIATNLHFQQPGITARIVASNLTWLGELLLGVLLLPSATRHAAAWLVLVLMAAIQSGAGEYYFASILAVCLAMLTPIRAFRWIVAIGLVGLMSLTIFRIFA